MDDGGINATYSLINASPVQQKSKCIKVEPSSNVPLYTVVDKKIKSKRSSTPEYSGAESRWHV